MNKILTTREGVTMNATEIEVIKQHILDLETDNDTLRVELQLKEEALRAAIAQIAALMNSQKVDYSV